MQAGELAPPAVRASSLLRRSLRLWRTRIGVLLVAALALLAIIGPYVAPYGPSAAVGAPNTLPGGKAVLGTDYLGQDVLSRLLYGGRSILVMAVVATAIGLVVGVVIGLLAAYSRNALDDVLMRGMDVIMAFPQIMLALVAVAIIGPKTWVIVVAIALTTVPRIARVARGAAQPVVERDFIACSEAMGVPRWRILFGELLPNTLGPLMVEASLRVTYSIAVIAGAGVPRARTQSQRRELGHDDPGESDRPAGPALGRRRADHRHRAADDGHWLDRRRHRAYRSRHRPDSRCGVSTELAEPPAEPITAAVSVQGLQIEIGSTGTPVVSDVSFGIARGEILGLVGESGSGKTTVGLALLGHARRGLRIAGGSVLLGDRDVLTLDEEQLRKVRGSVVSYVPQDPASSLNPGAADRPAAAGGTGGARQQRAARHLRARGGDDARGRAARRPRLPQALPA